MYELRKDVLDKLVDFVKDRLKILLKEIEDEIKKYEVDIDKIVNNTIDKIPFVNQIPCEKIDEIKNSFKKSLKYELLIQALYSIGEEFGEVSEIDVTMINYVLDFLRILIDQHLRLNPGKAVELVETYSTLYYVKRDLLISQVVKKEFATFKQTEATWYV